MSVQSIQDTIVEQRQLLIHAIIQEKNLLPVFSQLISLDCSLRERYYVLHLDELLQNNSESLDNLKQVGMAFNIFEKYCRHLMKPEEQRSQMWRFVKFTNNIFRDRVDIIKGGRDIMRKMGYTLDIQDGLSFPPGAHTDPDSLIYLLADILCAKRELDSYLLGEHPRPGIVECLLPYKTQIEVNQLHKQIIQSSPLVLPSERRQVQTQIHQASHQQNLSLPKSSTAIIAQDRRSSSSSVSGYQEYSGSQPIQSNASQTTLSAASVNTSAQKDYRDAQFSSVQEGSTRESPEREDSIVCDICGDSTAEVVCSVCDSKQLCPACDVRWHQHPKRKNHTRQTLSGKADVSGEEYHSAEEIIPPPRTYPKSPVSPPSRTYHVPPPHIPQSNSGYVNIPNSAAEPSVGQRREDNSELQRTTLDMKYQDNMNSSAMMDRAKPSSSGYVYDIPFTQQSVHTTSPQNMGYATLPPERATPTHQSLHYSGSLPRPAPGGPPTSKLLPNIMQITDLNRRKSKLEISIMSLQEEIDETEEKIQAVIRHNSEFYDDEEYDKLCKKKGRYQREVMELQKYEKDLDTVLEGKADIEHHGSPTVGHQSLVNQPIFYPPPYTSMPIGPSSTSPNSMVNPAGVVYPYPYISSHGRQQVYFPPTSSPAQGAGYGYHIPVQGIPAYQEPHMAHHHGYIQSPSMYTGQGHPRFVAERHSHNHNFGITPPPQPHDASKQCVASSGYVNSPTYSQNRQNVCSDQDQGNMNYNIPPVPSADQKIHNFPDRNKFSVQNIPSTPKEKVQASRTGCDINQVVKSPDFKKMPVSQGTVYQNYPREEDIPPPILDRKPLEKTKQPQGRTRKKSEGYHSNWICQHCTYHNPAQTNVCEMCFKTSSNPTFLDMECSSISTDMAKSVSPKSDGSPSVSLGKMEKQASGFSGVNPALGAEVKAKVPEDDVDRSEETKLLQKARDAGKLLQQNYDQIYFEKQEAHRKYNEKLRRETENKALEKQRMAESKMKDQAAAVANANIAENITSVSVKHTNDHITNPSTATMEKNTGNSDKATAQRTSEQVGSTDRGSPRAQGKVPLSFSETMDKINKERQQAQMMIEGKELVQYLKMSEKAGFDVDEAQIALERKDTATSSLAWLKEKWLQMVNTVIAMAANEGANMQQNEVGEVSSAEAREALKETKGNVPQAVKICVAKRQQLYKDLTCDSQYPRENVLRAMHQSQGDVEEAQDALHVSVLESYLDRLWITDEGNPPGAVGGGDTGQAMQLSNDVCNSITNSVLGHVNFKRLVTNTAIQMDRRQRMIMVEGKLQSWGRAETVIKILDVDVAKHNLEATLEEVVEAVRNCGDRQSSLAYLQQECQLCYSFYPMGKIRSLNCPCKICVDCMKNYFEISIREKHVRNLCCPMCQLPDMENVNAASDYFTFLTMLLSTMVSKEILDLYHSKLRDWHLQKDPNFRWCTHCGGGFIYGAGDNLAMTCPHCQKKTCFKCKKQWEDQHEGLTCQQFEQWKIDNDPENQAMGLAAHLEANGIDCPSCKMRYSLAKGGCMHFTCPQCGHQFCSGCGHMFDSQGMCTKYHSCRGKGLHCHHPRDCFYYLRDKDIPELQKLLKDKNIVYNTEIPQHQGDRNHCPVMEQKEINDGKQDEACGKEIQVGHAGLCLIHYKEYLVYLINKNHLDPVHVMTIEELCRLIERDEKEVLQKKPNEKDAHYRKRLMQYIKEKIPIQRR